MKETPNPQPIDDSGSHSGGSAKWVVVGVLAVICMLNYGVRTSIAGVYPLLKTELGFTDIGLGAMGSFFLWSYALASPFAGHLGDKFDRRHVVLWSLVGWSIVTAASGLVTARWELLAMRVLLGVVESLFLPAAIALVADYHSAKTMGTAQGLLVLGQSFGLVGGTTLAGFVADRFGWRPSLWVLGIAGLVVVVPAYFLLERCGERISAQKAAVNGAEAAPAASFGAAAMYLLKIPSFWVLLAAGALPAIGTWIFLNWLPMYFKETFAMSLAVAGFFGASFINGSAAVGTVLGGLVSDRVARKGEQYRMLLHSLLMLAAGPVLLVFLGRRRLVVIVVALVVNSLLRYAADLNILPVLCDLAGKDKSSVAFGITNMVNCLVAGGGVLAAGILKARVGLAGVFAGTVGILICDAFILFLGFSLFLKRDLERAAHPA